jgi:alanine dehydrogenase
MSEVAGRMAVQAGARCLEQSMGGSGILLGGVPGVEPAKVVIIGAGVAGSHALAMATGLGADVTVIDRDLGRLKALDAQYAGRVRTVFSTRDAIEQHVMQADLVIGGVLIPGAAAPKLVTAAMVKTMKPGAVIVDVAIDQGGCCETSRPTTHAEPTYVVDGVVHYCVANMPGGVPRTSTIALNNVTLPHIQTLAVKGYKQALLDDVHLRNGLKVHRGIVTCAEVAEALGYVYIDPLTALEQ